MEQFEVVAYMINDRGERHNVICWVDTRKRLSRWRRQQLGPEPEPLKPKPMSRYAQDMLSTLLRKW